MPSTQLHNSAVDTTELSSISQNLKKNKTPYFPRRPQRFEPLSRQHTHGFAVTLENHRLLSFQRVAPPPRSLVCCGGWFVCLHTQQPRIHLMSQRPGTSMLSGTPKKFDLRFEGKASPNVLQSLTCVQYGKCHQILEGPAAGFFQGLSFSTNQRSSRGRDNFFAIIFFFRGLAY